MTRDVVCVGPETSASEIARLFLAMGISGVPVVNEQSHPLGVVSKTDLLRRLAEVSEPARARDVMTPVTLAMPAHASVARAAALMSYERVHRVIVVGASGNVVGVVSAIDILRWLAHQDGFAIP